MLRCSRLAERSLASCGLRTLPPSPTPKRRAATTLPPVTRARALLSDFGLWAALIGSPVVGEVVSGTGVAKRFGLSSPVVTMFTAWALCMMGLIPNYCPDYDFIMAKIVPAAASLLLLETSLSDIATAGGKTLGAFLLGSIGTVVGTFAAWSLCGSFLGAEGWKVAAALCGSYIGGSVNFAAIAEASQLADRALFAAATAADNVAMAGYLAVVMAIGAQVDRRARLEERRSGEEDSEENRGGAAESLGPDSNGSGGAVPSGAAEAAAGWPAGSVPGAEEAASDSGVLWGLGAAVLSVALGRGIAASLGAPAWGLAFSALLASGIGTAVQLRPSQGQAKPPSPFVGSRQLGSALMGLFFACIGASAALPGDEIAALGPRALYLTAFIAVQLGVHVVFAIGVGRAVGLPMREILIASNANVGGPATAAAMAGARGWKDLLTPAVLVGCFGYAIGTTIGLSVGFRLG